MYYCCDMYLVAVIPDIIPAYSIDNYYSTIIKIKARPPHRIRLGRSALRELRLTLQSRHKYSTTKYLRPVA